MSSVRKFDEEELSEIMNGEFDGAKLIDDHSWIDGWFQHTEYIFVFEGIQYEFEYKRHTSPRVSDGGFVRYANPSHIQPLPTITPDEVAATKFIQDYLQERGYSVSLDFVKLVFDGQVAYLNSIGIV